MACHINGAREMTMRNVEEGAEFGSLQRVLVTGANGFIGQALCASLLSRGRSVVGAARQERDVGAPGSVPLIAMGNVDEHTDWSSALSGVDCVVHLLARVHQMHDTAANPEDEFNRINAALTLNLARQAAACGVRRFVFMSSVKVNGEQTACGRPFAETDAPAPLDPYARSKRAAEEGLVRLASETNLNLVIIRCPLVYGAGVKGNFLSMVRWLQSGLPLPLGALHNRRSMIAIDNLTDFIITCLDHPLAVDQTFLVSDGDDLTVTAMLRRTAIALQKSPRLIPVPPRLLCWAGRVVGKTALVQRLCFNLQVDITKARRMLGWAPPVSVDVALKKTVQAWLR